jgi:hypothetical protein
VCSGSWQGASAREVAALAAELRAKVSALGACASLTRLRSIRLLMPYAAAASFGFA